MFRYRGYDWALVPGESHFEVHLQRGAMGSKPLWWLRLQYIAVGAEWRRCHYTERPQVFAELNSFDVPPGDWRNLSQLNYWNIERSCNWWEFDGPRAGEFNLSFMSSSHVGIDDESRGFAEVNWRVVEAEGPLFTIELSADRCRSAPSPGALEPVSAIPGQAVEPETASIAHDVYLLETVPFGVVNVQVPRNARDPFAYAEALARRTFRTPAADHMKLLDFLQYDAERKQGEIHVELHHFGYHGA